MENARRGARGQDIDAFLEALAVSHTVMATTNAQGTMTYEAESPDEFALVSAAADLGWAFKATGWERLGVGGGTNMYCGTVVRQPSRRWQTYAAWVAQALGCLAAPPCGTPPRSGCEAWTARAWAGGCALLPPCFAGVRGAR